MIKMAANFSGTTHNVLSLGIWLKLATDSRVMLLLLRVLQSQEEAY